MALTRNFCAGKADHQGSGRLQADCPIQKLVQATGCLPEEVRKWVDTVPDMGINRRPGRKVGDSTCRLQVRESLGLGIFEGKQFSAEVLADLTKADEGVDGQALIDKAKRHGFPLNVLFISLSAYKWQ